MSVLVVKHSWTSFSAEVTMNIIAVQLGVSWQRWEYEKSLHPLGFGPSPPPTPTPGPGVLTQGLTLALYRLSHSARRFFLLLLGIFENYLPGAGF
jgi:hypothetical protein